MKNALLFLLTLQFSFMAMAQNVAIEFGARNDTEYTRKTLKDLAGIGVSVSYRSSYAIKDGLSRDLILTDVESRLRMSGINVLTAEEIVSTPGMPTLDVSVQTIAFDGRSNYFISVGVMQWVVLQRDPQSKCGARTWSTEMFISGEAINLQYLQQTLKELVDKFINAYLSVNPRK